MLFPPTFLDMNACQKCWQIKCYYSVKSFLPNVYLNINTPFNQLLQTRVCFTNAGINTDGAEIHKVRKHAIYAFPSFLFLILLFRLYVQEPFSEIMERQNNRLV